MRRIWRITLPPITAAAALSIAISASAHQPPKGAPVSNQPAAQQRNEAVVRGLYDCIQRNDSACFEALVSSAHVDHSNSRNGPAGFAAAAQNLHRAYSDFDTTIENLIVSGDLVVVQWRETGMHTGQFFNLRPTNKPFEANGLNMYRVVDGKILESWIAVDPKTFRAQMAAQAALSAQ